MADFLALLGALGEIDKKESTSFAKSSPSEGTLIPSPTTGISSQPVVAGIDVTPDTIKPVDLVDSPTVPDLSTVSSKSSNNELAKKALAIDVAGTALSTLGGLQNIKAQEADAMEQLAMQHQIALEDLQANANLRQVARGASRSRALLARIRSLEQQNRGGGVQTQQFIRDPQTGARV